MRGFQLLFLLMFALELQAQQPIEVIQKPRMTRKTVRPTQSFLLDAKIPEGSGLISWRGKLWTHNDSGDTNLYALDSLNGSIVANCKLPGRNLDWEDIGQDSLYFYLSETGNNYGQKARQHIFRIGKSSIGSNLVKIDTIAFSWPETINKGKIKKVNFDCEALIVIGDSIFLFTKEWKMGRRTRVFSLSKMPGTYVAKYKNTIKSKVVITGASWFEDSRQLVLCGYNFWLRPHLLIFPNVKNTDFFAGKGTKLKIKRRFRQTEGVSTFDGKTYYVINEDFKFLFLHTKQELHKIKIP